MAKPLWPTNPNQSRIHQNHASLDPFLVSRREYLPPLSATSIIPPCAYINGDYSSRGSLLSHFPTNFYPRRVTRSAGNIHIESPRVRQKAKVPFNRLNPPYRSISSFWYRCSLQGRASSIAASGVVVWASKPVSPKGIRSSRLTSSRDRKSRSTVCVEFYFWREELYRHMFQKKGCNLNSTNTDIAYLLS